MAIYIYDVSQMFMMFINLSDNVSGLRFKWLIDSQAYLIKVLCCITAHKLHKLTASQW